VRNIVEKSKWVLSASLILSLTFLLSGCSFFNQPPSANFSADPTSGKAPLKVSFDASSSSDSDGTTLIYKWKFGDNHSASGEVINHTYESAGTYTVELTATDDQGATDTATKTNTVSSPPSGIPTASFTASPTEGTVPLEVSFDASESSDPDGKIDSYAWNFDDGERGSGKSTVHTFEDSGTYNVQLTVTDDSGNKNSSNKEIAVEPSRTGSFSGAGDAVTRTFTLPEGILIFDLSHNGDSNFIVQLLKANTGELESNLVNEIGSFSGEVLVGVSQENSIFSSTMQNKPLDVQTAPGEFKLKVTADGGWNIDFVRDDSTVGILELPQYFGGPGHQVTQPIQLPADEITFSFQYEGDSNFIVTLYKENGSYQELLANEIGSYSGKTIIDVGSESYQPSPGIYYLSVMAEGSWELGVEADVKRGTF